MLHIGMFYFLTFFFLILPPIQSADDRIDLQDAYFVFPYYNEPSKNRIDRLRKVSYDKVIPFVKGLGDNQFVIRERSHQEIRSMIDSSTAPGYIFSALEEVIQTTTDPEVMMRVQSLLEGLAKK